MKRYVITAELDPPKWFEKFEEILESCGFKDFNYMASSGPLEDDKRAIRYAALGDESCVLILKLKIHKDRVIVRQLEAS